MIFGVNTMSGQNASFSSYPNGFAGGLILDGLATHKTHTGKVFHVGDGDTAGNTPVLPNRKTPSDGNKGGFLDPYKTLLKAVEQCVDARGDVIVVLPGYVESIEAAIDIEAGNVTILGLGTGDDRPQITPGILDMLDVEGDNVTIQNMYFNETDAERTAGSGMIDVVGTGFRFLGNHVDLGAHDDVVITVTATAEQPIIAGNKFVVTANGTESIVDIEGVVDNPQFRDNVIVSSVAALDEAFVDMEAIAVTNTLIEGNRIFGATSLVVATADVGTQNFDNQPGAQLKTFVNTEIDSETAAAVASIESGTVALWGVSLITSNSNGATSKYGLSTEAAGPDGALTIGVAADEDLAAAGDMVTYGTNPGGTQAVIEIAGNQPDPMWASPLYISGNTEIDLAPEVAAEGVFDLVLYYTPVTAGAVIAAAE